MKTPSDSLPFRYLGEFCLQTVNFFRQLMDRVHRCRLRSTGDIIVMVAARNNISDVL
jgi:hypothetical protein